jgi:hypothetical protein
VTAKVTAFGRGEEQGARLGADVREVLLHYRDDGRGDATPAGLGLGRAGKAFASDQLRDRLGNPHFPVQQVDAIAPEGGQLAEPEPAPAGEPDHGPVALFNGLGKSQDFRHTGDRLLVDRLARGALDHDRRLDEVPVGDRCRHDLAEEPEALTRSRTLGARRYLPAIRVTRRKPPTCAFVVGGEAFTFGPDLVGRAPKMRALTG